MISETEQGSHLLLDSFLGSAHKTHLSISYAGTLLGRGVRKVIKVNLFPGGSQGYANTYN